MIGLTGPPGVGKSTLVSALVRAWRAQARTVGVIAVDPSSRRTGGALLGDRTRIDVDPEDQGVFVRSLAARERLGGLADLAAAAMVLMRAIYDIVLVETVGVGQSETEIAEIADTVVFAVQPGSGDSLQFMKAGIVEIPDVALVTKADLGAIAERAKRDLEESSASFREAADGSRRCCWFPQRRGRGSTERWRRSSATRHSSLPIAAPAGRRRTRRGWRGGCARNLAGVAPCASARACRRRGFPVQAAGCGSALQVPLDLRASGWPVRGNSRAEGNCATPRCFVCSPVLH